MSDDPRHHQQRDDVLDQLQQWIDSSQSGQLREIIERARQAQQDLENARRVDPESLKVPVTL